MKIKKLIVSLVTAFMALLLVATPVMAYSYYGAITVVEANGTDYTMLGLNVPVSNSTLVSGGYISASGLDTAIKNSGASSMPHMLVTDKVLFASGINGSNSAVFNYEMGNAPISAFSIVPGYGGYITTADAAALEPANNFEVEISGYFDTSAAGKYILKKTGVLELYTSGVSEITGTITATAAALYGTGNDDANRSIYGVEWAAYTFAAGATASCSGADVYIQKSGSPAGNLTLGLYATAAGVPSGAPLATASMLANDVGAGLAMVNFTFATPQPVTNTVTYAIVLSCPSGDAGNYIIWRYRSASNVYTGAAKTSGDSGGTWSNLNYDFNVTVNAVTQKTVVGAGITTGVHVIKLTADTTDLKLFDGAIEKDSEALSGASVGGNANNFVWMNNDSVPYATYIKYTVGGVLVITYQPVVIISGTALPDTTGAAQNGVITFGANPAGVTVSIGSLSSSGASYTSPASTNTEANVVPSQSQPMSAATGVTSSPFYPFFSAIYTASGDTLDVDLQAMMFAILFAVGFAIMGGVISQGRSFFLVIAGLGVGSGIGFALRFYQDVWILYIIVVLAIAALLLDARKSW